MTPTSPACQIIVGVPGMWADHTAFVRSVATASPMPCFLAAGGILMDMQTHASLRVELHQPCSTLADAFRIACGGRMTEDELLAIRAHQSIAYLLSDRCSVAEARQVMQAARHLLDAGGIGVKVDSAGVAHSADRWRYLTASPSMLSVYEGFVTLVGGDSQSFHYSCGMHNLGLADTSISGIVPVAEAAEILTCFNHWSLVEHPALGEGAAFSCAANLPVFSISHRKYGYPPGDPLNNPFGRWHLEPTHSTGHEHLRTDDSQGTLFMALERDDQELLRAVATARSTAGYFLDHFRSAYEYGTYLVNIHLRDGEESAFLWAHVEQVDVATITARFFEIQPEFASYQTGQAVTLSTSELFDWCIIKNGCLIGGFSMRIQRGKLPSQRRHAYDLFAGTISYAPLTEIPGYEGSAG